LNLLIENFEKFVKYEFQDILEFLLTEVYKYSMLIGLRRVPWGVRKQLEVR